MRTFVDLLGSSIKCTPIFFSNVLVACMCEGLIGPDTFNAILELTNNDLTYLTCMIDNKDMRRFIYILRREDTYWFLHYWYATLRQDIVSIEQNNNILFMGLNADELINTTHMTRVVYILNANNILTNAEKQHLLDTGPSAMIELFGSYVRAKGRPAVNQANTLLKSYYAVHNLKLK